MESSFPDDFCNTMRFCSFFYVEEVPGRHPHSHMTPLRFVSPRKLDHKWIVKLAKAHRAAAVTETQAEAIKIARGIARRNKEELVIQGLHGQIRQKDSYGNDPPEILG